MVNVPCDLSPVWALLYKAKAELHDDLLNAKVDAECAIARRDLKQAEYDNFVIGVETICRE